jgi:myosin heavy subunit
MLIISLIKENKYFLNVFRKPFKTNIFQKERFNQNTVTIHFKASLAELLDKMKEAEPSFVRYVGQYVNVT